MQKVPSLNGWNYDEVLLVYGLVTLSKSINHMFADNLWTLGRIYIRSGGFDRFLVRPIDPLFHLLADRFCQDGVGNFLVGIALVIKSSVDLGIAWTPSKLLVLIVGVVSGGFIFIALEISSPASARSGSWIWSRLRAWSLTIICSHNIRSPSIPKRSASC